MKLLITGVAGFIGMHAGLRLLERGHEIVGVDSLNAYYDPALKRARLEQLRQARGFTFEKLDVADAAALERVFAQHAFDGVLHFAAQAGVRYSLENPMAYADSNLTGFLSVLEACRKARIAHLCYASSSSVYGANSSTPFREEDRVDQPESLYAATKRANELMAHCYSRLYGLNCTGLRLFTVYGPWGRPDMAPFLFARAILEGKPIRAFNGGRMQRDFTYIDDIVEAVVKIAERPPALGARLYNVGHGSPVELMDFIGALERAFGRKAVVEMAPMQPGEVVTTYASTEKLKTEYGYQPETSIEVGVGRFAAWYRGQYAGTGGIAA